MIDYTLLLVKMALIWDCQKIVEQVLIYDCNWNLVKVVLDRKLETLAWPDLKNTIQLNLLAMIKDTSVSYPISYVQLITQRFRHVIHTQPGSPQLTFKL